MIRFRNSVYLLFALAIGFSLGAGTTVGASGPKWEIVVRPLDGRLEAKCIRGCRWSTGSFACDGPRCVGTIDEHGFSSRGEHFELEAPAP